MADPVPFSFASTNDPRIIRACAAARARDPYLAPYVRIERKRAEVDLTRATAYGRYLVMQAIRTEFERSNTGRAVRTYDRFELQATAKRMTKGQPERPTGASG